MSDKDRREAEASPFLREIADQMKYVLVKRDRKFVGEKKWAFLGRRYRFDPECQTKVKTGRGGRRKRRARRAR